MTFSHAKDRHCQKCGMHYVWAINREVTREEAEECSWMEGGEILESPTLEEEKNAIYWAGEYGDNEYEPLEEMHSLDIWGSSVCEDCEKWLREIGFESMFDGFEDEGVKE